MRPKKVGFGASGLTETLKPEPQATKLPLTAKLRGQDGPSPVAPENPTTLKSSRLHKILVKAFGGIGFGLQKLQTIARRRCWAVAS